MIARKAPWNERNGRFSPLKAVVFAALFAPAPLHRLSARDRRAGPQARHRNDPSLRRLGGAAHPAVAAHHAVAKTRRMAEADRGQTHGRGRRLRLCGRACLSLYRRSELQSPARRLRDRAALLSDDRLRRASRPCGARRDLDRRDDPPPRQPRAGICCTRASMGSPRWRCSTITCKRSSTSPSRCC